MSVVLQKLKLSFSSELKNKNIHQILIRAIIEQHLHNLKIAYFGLQYTRVKQQELSTQTHNYALHVNNFIAINFDRCELH